MDRNLALEAVRVTERAALAAAKFMGRGKIPEADQAAVTAMRNAFQNINIKGTVVIGEGERDEAPMLFIGEPVGLSRDHDTEIDIAVDPIEGTNLCAYGRPNALSVIAIAPKGKLLHAPDIYMDKIAVGPTAKGVIDLDKTPTQNLMAIADAKGVYVEDLTAVVLERPRHKDLIDEIRQAGARVQLISDGDVSAAISTCIQESGVDVLFGIGGAPEGVIAAAAIKCVGGELQARLVINTEEERDRCLRMGITDLNKKWYLEELASGEVIFAATGITNGDILKGVRFFKGKAKTHSLVMRSSSGTIRMIETEHRCDRKL